VDFGSWRAYAEAKSLGAGPMGARVTAQLAHDERFYGDGGRRDAEGTRRTGTRATRLRDRMGLGSFWGMDDEDED
jgi:DDB1- and CUL4-associated factor 11